MLALTGAFTVVGGLVVGYGGVVAGLDRPQMMIIGPAGWGRASLLLGGLLFALAGWLCLVTVRVWPVAVPLVAVHALAELAVLAAAPAWALLTIALDVIVIFTLTVTPAGAARGGPLLGAGRHGPVGRRGAPTTAGAALPAAGAARAVRRVPAVHSGTALPGSAPAVHSGTALPGVTRVTGSGATAAGTPSGGRLGYRPRHQLAHAPATAATRPTFIAAPTSGAGNRAVARHGSRVTRRALPPGPPARGNAGSPAAPVTAQPADAGHRPEVILGAISGRDPDHAPRIWPA
jgi:hypothetical protein